VGTGRDEEPGRAEPERNETTQKLIYSVAFFRGKEAAINATGVNRASVPQIAPLAKYKLVVSVATNPEMITFR
jgi:hypothetical protein